MDGKKENLIKAREVLCRETPLDRRNCGKICSSRCCRGEENDGMGLFPGESGLLEGTAGFRILPSQGNFGQPVLVCGSDCPRERRPLACMIFPLFPLAVEREGRLEIIPVPDIRAARVCPLLNSPRHISKRFYRAVRLAGKYLVRDDECRKYLLELSAGIIEISDMAGRLAGAADPEGES